MSTYGYEEGVQGYLNQSAVKNSGGGLETTFQKRGYLTERCVADIINSRSKKSIADQLKAIDRVRNKHGAIDESTHG